MSCVCVCQRVWLIFVRMADNMIWKVILLHYAGQIVWLICVLMAKVLKCECKAKNMNFGVSSFHYASWLTSLDWIEGLCWKLVEYKK